jgi:subfamily B ATP-binding cassette protein MsbA
MTRGSSSPVRPTLSGRVILGRMRDLMWPRRRMLLGALLLLLVGRLSGLVLPGATKYLIDDVIGEHNPEHLTPLLAVVALATVIQAVTSYALTQILSRSAQRLIAEYRIKVQRHIGRLPLSYYDHNKTGALVSRIMSDAEGVRNLIGTGLLELVGGLVTASVAFLLMLRLNVTLTLCTVTFLGLFAIVLRRAFAVIRPIFRERGEINAEVTGRLSETLGGVRVVKGFHAEEREAAVFAGGAMRLFENVRRTLVATSLVGLASTLLVGAVGVTVMAVGGRLILAGEMTIGGFFAFSLYLGLLAAPAFQMVAIGSQLTEAFAGLDRMEEVFRERPEDEDPDRTRSLGTIEGEIRFEAVGFAYEAGKPVLREVSLVARPGTVTALVGPSGSGKSTLIGLVAGFAIPSTGGVLVDGVDLKTVRLADYRSQLGVVLQDSFLFDGTIRENIAFGRPGASEPEVEAAAKLAHVDEFTSRFELGLDTVVGERGVKLSGGQRQRVSIARAVLADPRILILDEATSTLDSESEAYIQEGLKTLMRGRTTFVIAHRLSTIRNADQILVLERGEVVERGRHDELLAKRGRYFDLYTKQAGIEANRFVNPGEAPAEEPTPEAPAAPGGGPPAPDPLQILRGTPGG